MRSFLSIFLVIGVTLAATIQNVCQQDIYLLELINFGSFATIFCQKYAKTGGAIPAYLKNSYDNPSKVSSACSCLMKPTSTTITKSTSTSTTKSTATSTSSISPATTSKSTATTISSTAASSTTIISTTTMDTATTSTSSTITSTADITLASTSLTETPTMSPSSTITSTANTTPASTPPTETTTTSPSSTATSTADTTIPSTATTDALTSTMTTIIETMASATTEAPTTLLTETMTPTSITSSGYPIQTTNNGITFQYLGCYTDNVMGDRALVNSPTLFDDQMTTELCVDYCHQPERNTVYAGTEFGRECYCGNAFMNGNGPATDPATCNMQCEGNSTEICGGPDRLSVYQFVDASQPSSTAT